MNELSGLFTNFINRLFGRDILEHKEKLPLKGKPEGGQLPGIEQKYNKLQDYVPDVRVTANDVEERQRKELETFVKLIQGNYFSGLSDTQKQDFIMAIMNQYMRNSDNTPALGQSKPPTKLAM